MEGYKNIGKNTFVQLIGKAVSTIIGIFTTILLTRYLGPTGFGDYSYVAVFLTLFGVVSDWGFNLIAIREASQKTNERQRIVSTTFIIKIVLGFVAAILANIVANFLSQDSYIKTLILIASIQLVFISIKTSSQIIFNVTLRMENWAISEIVGNLAIFLGTIFIVFTSQSLATYFVFLNIAYLLSATTAYFLARKLMRFSFAWDKAQIKYLVSQAVPMGAILAVFTIYNRMDTLILNHFWGSQVVGWYAAAYRIFDVLTLGGAYYANSILPQISWQAQHDKKALFKTFKSSFFVLLAMGTIVALVCFFLAPIGVGIVAGPEFIPSVAALRILSVALIVSYFNHLTGYILIALKRQTFSLKIAIVALIVNIVLNLVLVPRYSLYAAAATTFVTEALIASFTLLYVFKRLH